MKRHNVDMILPFLNEIEAFDWTRAPVNYNNCSV